MTTETASSVRGRDRVLAVLSLGATILFAVAVVVFVARHAGYVVLGVAGFVVCVTGAWWTLTETALRRVLGIFAALVGAGAAGWAVFGAASDTEQRVVRLCIVGAVLIVAVVTARAALAGDIGTLAGRIGHPVPPPVRPVLLCNPWSGGGKVERFDLLSLASSLGVETVLLGPGLDLEQLARDAVTLGADCLGMAGGDGSQALVASIAVEAGLPFVCVSAGTRNHFALDLCLDRDDPRHTLDAFHDAIERPVDFATVNGRFFVNNVSLGVYATIVQQEGYREAKAETSRTLLPQLLGRTDRPFDLQFTTPDGEEIDGAFLVQVSNNPYVVAASADLSQRRRLDSGRLGVFAVTAASGAQAADAVTHALTGRSARSGHAFEFAADEFEVRSRSGKAYVGVDGEALELETPLRFRIHPRGLRLLVPKGNLELAVRRGARAVRLADLFAVVRGSRPARGQVASSSPLDP
ncbi:MAG: diacylglycerol kinase family protein [Acidimicrobiales bacterium]